MSGIVVSRGAPNRRLRVHSTVVRAAVIVSTGGPEVIEIRDVPAPVPAAGELLVRVAASALNRADLLQRAGRYPAPPGVAGNIPGIEFAGEVVDAGSAVDRARIGQRVFGIVGGAAHAEFLVAHERAVAAIPESLSWVQAGATPEAFITAHDAMCSQAALRPGDRVLIHAAGSGVGLAAVQLARAFGAVPYGTARTAEKLERAMLLGLENGIAVGEDLSPIPAAVEDWTNGRGVDVVLDLAGGPYVAASLEALAPRGRMMLVGTIAGRRSELDLGRMLAKRLRVAGTVLRSRPIEERIAVTLAFAAEVVPLLESGAVSPVIDSVHDLGGIGDAHRRLESNATFGKVVLRVSDDATPA